jgi:DNA polymerase III epsilon subunit-like protein
MIPLTTSIVHFDTETGGLKPHRHPMLSIAAFLLDHNGEELLSYQARCRLTPKHEQDPNHPQRFLSCDDDALKINGLDPNEGLEEEEFYTGFVNFLSSVKDRTGEKPYLCAFNASFDSGFLSALISRHNRNPFALLNLIYMPVLCAQQLMSLHCARLEIDRKWIRKPGSTRPSFSLPAIYYYLFNEVIDPGKTHDASIDALMSARVFQHLINYNYASASHPVL